MHRPRLSRALAVVLAGALAAAIVPRLRHGSLTPFVPQPPPQRALGDFDGDGRIDTATVQRHDGDDRISIQLSRSASDVRLDASVTGIVESDVDHDGDLDLVAETASGEVLIWLNDSYGRFTRKASTTQGREVSRAPVLVHTVWPESLAVVGRSSVVRWPAHAYPIVLVAKAHAPTPDLPSERRALALTSPRAPPLPSLPL